MRIRTILAAAAAPAALAAVLLGTAGQASAAVNPQGSAAAVTPKPVTYSATAHEANVADTTNVSGDSTGTSDGGPTWATDNMERKLTATDNGNGTWAVRVESQGSFSAFANPLDGNAYTGSGSVKGYINETVISDHAPSGANLAAQLPDTMRSGQIAAQWFGVNPSRVQSGSYSFDYNPVPVPSDVAFASGTNGIFYGQGPNGLHYTQVG